MRFLPTLLIACGITFPVLVHAAPVLTYTEDHHLFSIDVAKQMTWRQPRQTWYFRGVPAVPPARLRSCGRTEPKDPDWTVRTTQDWNVGAIEQTIRTVISSALDRPAGAVTISQSATGSIVFDGVGLPGRTVDVAMAARLTLMALEQDVAVIALPVIHTPPRVTVTDAELRAQGIRDVVMVGESVFATSPVNRRHNIGVGVARFNGHLIPQGSVFSFVARLGPVNASTGYRKELVIQGAETLPDYGGGLCQVSTTAYRGPWEYGLPIVQRKNHSYAVSYYSPQGTDATIYPPSVDMKFLNDTPGALLIQSVTDAQDRAYFIYYGTPDDREAEIFGPFITNRQAAPREERISYTTELPPGQRRKAGERHDGLRATWYRIIRLPGVETPTRERVVSVYEARPLTWQVGVAAIERQTEGETSGEPSWLPSNP